MTPPTDSQLLSLYEGMLRIRMFEQEVLERAEAKEGLAIHPSTGHEAVAVGILSQCKKEDLVVSNHRPFAHFIAKGGSLKELMAELYGKETGVCKGMGGEMNLSEPKIGFMQSFTIVGAGLTFACGVALSKKMLKIHPERSEPTSGITVCFFGDAASTNGAFNEALTLAKVFHLPILFVCENNGYSTNTPAAEYMPTDLVIHRASGYGFPTSVCDGSDVLAVWEAGQKAVEYVRRSRGPYLLECLVSRIGPHKQTLVDTRSPEAVRFARMRDPIPKLRTALLSEGLMTQKTESAILEAIYKEIALSIVFANA